MSDKAFNSFDLKVRTIEGGNIVTGTLSLDGTAVDSVEKIVAGKGNILLSRTRKCIKSICESVYPKPPKAEKDAAVAGQTALAGTQ